MAHQITRLSVALGMALGLMGATGCTRSISSTPGDAPNLQQWVDTIKNKGPAREREPLPLLTEQEVFSYADHMTVSINPNPESAIARAGAAAAPAALDAKVLEALGVEQAGDEVAKSWVASAKAFRMDVANAEHAKIFADKLKVAAGVDASKADDKSQTPTAGTADATTAEKTSAATESTDAAQDEGDKPTRKRIRDKASDGESDEQAVPEKSAPEQNATAEATAPTTNAAVSDVAALVGQVAPAAQQTGLTLDQTLALIQSLKHAGRGNADVAEVFSQLAAQDSAARGWDRVTAAPQATAPLLVEALNAGVLGMAKSHETVLAATGAASATLVDDTLVSDAELLADNRPLRSPFDLPQTDTGNRSKQALRPDSTRPKQALESFPLDSLAMVGTIGHGAGMVALIMSPDKVVYRVGTGQYLGQQDGRVTGIDEGQVQLVELVQDGSGGWVEQPANIVLTE